MSDFEKYLDKVREFYILKGKYENDIKNHKKKILLNPNSNETKKLLLSKVKYKCINCGNNGGTIFEINDSNYKAICGNVSQPCNLNINIKKQKFKNLKDLLIDQERFIKEKKNQITLTKLDYIFKYITEEFAVERFEILKSDLSKLQEVYNSYLENYITIVDNKERKDYLEQLLLEHHNSVVEFKDILKFYYDTQDSKYLKAAIEKYSNTIRLLDEKIMDTKYKYKSTEKNEVEENYYLIQNNYKLMDLEYLIKDENN